MYFTQDAFYPVLNYLSLYFSKNARENSMVNPEMVVKFTVLIPYYQARLRLANQ